MRSTTTQFAQCYLILAPFQHSKFNAVDIYMLHSLLTLETLHCLCVCMIAQLHALRGQQNQNLLSVEFSYRVHCVSQRFFIT